VIPNKHMRRPPNRRCKK